MSFGALEVRERLQSAGFNVRRTDLREHVSVSSHRDDQTHTPCPAGPSGGPPSDFVFPARRPLNVLLSAVFGTERHVLSRFVIAFGVSILALARRPPG